MARRALRIGLLNMMPDAALAATEVQFRALLEAAAGRRRVTLRGFSLAAVDRGDLGARYVQARYLPAEALPAARLDGLVVTGAEPTAARLEDEAFWPELVRTLDFAVAQRLPTVFSCLAAHAAAQHLHGVRRRPLAAKCSGVFRSAPRPHRLACALPPSFAMPHSRWNGLDLTEAERGGLRPVTISPEAGADALTGGPDGRFLLLQGHPEYAADTLLLEFRRDVRRFLTGRSDRRPRPPCGYFQAGLEAEIAVLDAEPAGAPGLLDRYEAILKRGRMQATWRPAAEALFSAWLGQVAEASADLAAA